MKQLVSILLFLLLFPTPTYAHAFGQMYNLPIPLWLYLYGGAAAIVVSFILIGYFLTSDNKNKKIEYYLLEKKVTSKILLTLKVITFFAFTLTVAAGFIGINSSLLNINMTLFWVIFMLGFSYFNAFFGDIWERINPFKFTVTILERIQGKRWEGVVKYPKSLNFIPALIIFIIFIWIELFSELTPLKLSLLLTQYLLLNIICCFVFGKKNWFYYGDFFSVFFRLISSCSIFENRSGKIFLVPPFAKLISIKIQNFSLIIFIIFMLSSTAFDGLYATSLWTNIYYLFFPKGSFEIFQIIGLLGLLSLFLTIYLLTIVLAILLTKSNKKIIDLALDFTPSLIPIALVYNIAHYYTLLVIQGQSIISLISDPFGFGWDLFRTYNFVPNVGILNAGFVWYSQVGLILLGHIVGVLIAHLIALKIFEKQRQVLISQIPMLLLMVFYTIAGLWILSQSITVGG